MQLNDLSPEIRERKKERQEFMTDIIESPDDCNDDTSENFVGVTRRKLLEINQR